MSGVLHGGRHDWLGHLQPTGLVVAPAVLERLGLWPEPQDAADNRALADALAALADGDAWPLFRDVLGWPADRVAGSPGGAALPPESTVSLREGETLLAADWAVAGGEGVQLLVRIEDSSVPLDRRGALDGWEATAHQRFERLLRETGVAAGVLLGSRETGSGEDPLVPDLRLVVAPRGEQSGWIAWPLRSLAQVAGRGMLAGLKLLLDAHALFTGAASHRLTTVLAESRAAQAAVSTRLSGQVLAALHELLRGVDAAAPALVRALAACAPHQLYEGLLTVLMRLIFILYAEDRGLMPSAGGGAAAALYEQGYALGGLHVRLRDDAARNPDTMDERRGAWGRLMALFRLVDRGHPSGFMQARGGTLFDERAFPFLLGREGPDDPEVVLPVSDGCVLRVLDLMMVLGAERLSYRALDVEQIGSVYETVMGFTVERAAGPALAIRAGKANRVPVWLDLAALARVEGAERTRRIREVTGRGQFPAAVARAIRAATDAGGLAAALAPVVDLRACPRGQAAGAGTPILQPTDERRRTGSHYTPRALTGPIVAHALAPAFARIGAEATPRAVLDLKVCDPAVGSGAFLVEACRQLGARLVAAWERWPAQRPTIPADEDALLHAKRLVAQHCLRGVDRNPMALDLAKLSLWLETLASAHEFTFLDHVLRTGDSLVGLPNPRIMAVTWNGGGKAAAQHSFVEAIVRDGIRAAAELGRLMRAEAEIAPYAVQAARYREANVALARAHLVADAILAAFFAGTSARDRQARLAEVQQWVLAPGAASWAKLAGLRDVLREPPIGIAGFHWELAFDDVFDRANPGFDAIVGNPPFAGKNTIAGGNPRAYPEWLRTLHRDAHGNADLSAHFFRRAYALLREGGAFGLIATNTIRQGDTRATGLARIVAERGTIYRAVSRHRWEGEAAVVVAQVFVRKGGGDDGTAMLDGRPVRRISAYLVEGDLDGSPAALPENAGLAFAGYEIYGMGFTFDDVHAAQGKATPLAEMDRLIAEDPRNAALIRPYLGGEEVNTSPTHAHHRYAIDFGDRPLRRAEGGADWATLSDAARQAQLRGGVVAHDYPLSVAADWPALLAIVERLVKPERDRLGDDGVDRRRKLFWWQYGVSGRNLAAALTAMEDGTCLVTNRGATPHLAFAIVPAHLCLAKTLAVFALSGHAAFATLQSRVHEVWARTFASSMKDDLRYTPSDCFETFPLPPGYADAPALAAAGRAYHDHRAATMVARGQGMTPTYNRFHAETDAGDDIVTLPQHDLSRVARDDWDDQLADLHYRDSAAYAVGLGCATVHAADDDGAVREVRTTHLPRAAVERTVAAEVAGVTFGMDALAALARAGGEGLGAALAELVDAYRAWTVQQADAASQAGIADAPQRAHTAAALVAAQRTAARRIGEGIALLAADERARTAFAIANRAVADALRARIGDPALAPAWRPFQLAFILLNLAGMADRRHPDREVADLLFFPTGGGKTEAYLGLAAFTIATRRLGAAGLLGSGVSVVMRYTLRLLTLDQLGRAAGLVCALELLRTGGDYRDPDGRPRLGDWPIEIGLWVGSDASPNRLGGKGDRNRDSAVARVRAFQSGRDPRAPAPIKACPWCGTAFTPQSFRCVPHADRPTNLELRCASAACAFTGDRALPVVSVDEAIYRRLPAFLIATVDKFASLPWKGEAGAFFGHVDRADDDGFYGAAEPGRGRALDGGSGAGWRLDPPDLVVQDELHLISGPLGTVAGLYEAAIDALATREVAGTRVRPKIVASTATVRRARDQIRALFDRDETQIFPVPGIDRRDSFFAVTKPESADDPARWYVGLGAAGRGPKLVFLQALVTLLAGTDDTADADAYRTALCYFNALRELGGARRIVEDEVAARVARYGGERRRLEPADRPFADRALAEPIELTSRVSTDQVAAAKRRLEAVHASNGFAAGRAEPVTSNGFAAGRAEPVDVALATNMISVGLDIDRLGLMLVQGQPKTAAEYIQATSRVGRNPARPGLVVAVLNVHKPRDRMHFEQFGHFHDTFYRAVEATSVTPWSARAMDRALAAVVVAIARHLDPALTPATAVDALERTPATRAAVIRHLVDRAPADVVGGKAALAATIGGLLDDWVAIAAAQTAAGVAFTYGDRPQRLLHPPLDPVLANLDPAQRRFQAGYSMRDVEPGVLLKPRGPEGERVAGAGDLA